MASAVAVEALAVAVAGLRRLAKRAARAEVCDEGVGDGAEVLLRRVCDVCVESSEVWSLGGSSGCGVLDGSGIVYVWTGSVCGGSIGSSPIRLALKSVDADVDPILSLGVGIISPSRSSSSEVSSSSSISADICVPRQLGAQLIPPSSAYLSQILQSVHQQFENLSLLVQVSLDL